LDIDKIIAGCQNKDRRSQDELVRRFAPTLMSVCLRYCKDTELAKDALQETFINIFKYIHNYSGSGSFEGWMRKIAVNCSYSFLNKARPVFFNDNLDIVRYIPTSIPDIYSELGKNELLKIIQLLPRNQYIVFNMKVIEGYSHSEIAEMLSINPSTSRSNLVRARNNLIRIIENNSLDEITSINKLKEAQ